MTSSSDNKVVLYYFPGSYYSLKALLALYEKDVSFEEQYVMIMTGEQNDKWYRKINKRGLVPTLLIGGECVAESERIIDLIDKNYYHGPELVPDTETVYGKEVHSFRKFLHDIPVDCITYGVFCNQQLSNDTSVMATFPQKLISKDFTEGCKQYCCNCTDGIRVTTVTFDRKPTSGRALVIRPHVHSSRYHNGCFTVPPSSPWDDISLFLGQKASGGERILHPINGKTHR